MDQPVAAEIVNLHKTFKTGLGKPVVHAVRGIDMNIRQGEVYGLIGPNGSGKSTLMKALLGLVRPTEGSCSIFGRSSLAPDSKEEVGFLPENPYFYKFLTGAETVSFYGRLCGLSGKSLKAKVRELLELVGLADAADRRLGGYSKGMLQRIGMAQALVQSPRLLVLDEPTAGVDPLGSRDIRNIIENLKGRGMTVFLCSHLLEQVQEVCDRVGVIFKGLLIAEGSVNELTRDSDKQEILLEHASPELMERLKDMVKYAYENTVYYKRSFDEAGVKPEDITSLADIEKFPFIDKKTERETQHVGSFFGEMCSVPEEDVVFMATSSGSTGVPTVSPFTQEDFDLWQSTEARLFWQAGMRPNDRYVHGLNFALYVGGPDVMGAQELGALAIWVGAVPSDRLLFVLKQYQPTVIWTSPSYAWALGEKAKEKGFDPREDFSIHTIIVAGEPGGSISSTREAIEDLWGAKVVDFFGLSDIYGACAAMCEAKDGLHIVEDQILVETVDPTTGEVLEPGSVGELTYTTLMKKARPMIRFRSGDIGYVSTDKCECGRTLARIHVTGRKDEMFIVGAVNVFPSDVEYVVRASKGLTGEYSIRVYDENYTTRYEVSVERALGSEEPYAEVAKRVEAALKAHCGVRPAKVIVYDAGKLGTSSAHKASRFVDERTQK